MAKIIAVCNQKGGVAKTTTTISLGACLAVENRTVLVVDMDPQFNLTTGLGINPKGKSMCQVLMGEGLIEDVVCKTSLAYLDVVPANLDLSMAESFLYKGVESQYILKNQLEKIRSAYDFIFIDCPPSLGILSINALTAADLVVIPVQCEYFSAKGLNQLLYIISFVRRQTNPHLDYRVLVTMYDRRNRICRGVLSELKKRFENESYETLIRIDTKLRECPSAGEPIITYAPGTRASREYKKLTAEILNENF